MALLGAAGIEAWTRVADVEFPGWMYSVVLIPLMLLTVVIPTTGIVPLQPLFAARIIVCSCVVMALVGVMIVCRTGEAHAGILLAFCLIDLCGYLGIVLGAPRFQPEAYLMIGQTACLGLWCWYAPRIKAL